MKAPPTGEDGFEPLASYVEYPTAEMEARAASFYSAMRRRRTTRHFSDRPVSRLVIEHCLRTAGTAPSGAHQQPWHFVAISDPAVKSRIRHAAEAAEREFYQNAPADWLEALAPLGTDAVKPYLDVAPWLIAVFAERYGINPDGSRRTHYYVNESVGIAIGFLLAALHQAGLVALTHTPSPMGFLRDVLARPENERPVLLLVTGYPASHARVPRLVRKALGEIATVL